MREHVEVIRRLLAMETVTYHGEFIHLDNVSLDVVYGDRSPRDIPIYIGATGDKMLELAGEICDGVCLNYGVSVDYIKRAIGLVGKGAQKAGKITERPGPAGIDRGFPVRSKTLGLRSMRARSWRPITSPPSRIS